MYVNKKWAAFISLTGTLRKSTRGCSRFSRTFICQTSARTCVILKRTHVHCSPSVYKLDASHDNNNPTLIVYFGISLCSGDVGLTSKPLLETFECYSAAFHINAEQFEGNASVCPSLPWTCSAPTLCDHDFCNLLFPNISRCLIWLYPAFVSVDGICFVLEPFEQNFKQGNYLQVNMIKGNRP